MTESYICRSHVDRLNQSDPRGGRIYPNVKDSRGQLGIQQSPGCTGRPVRPVAEPKPVFQATHAEVGSEIRRSESAWNDVRER